MKTVPFNVGDNVTKGAALVHMEEADEESEGD